MDLDGRAADAERAEAPSPPAIRGPSRLRGGHEEEEQPQVQRSLAPAFAAAAASASGSPGSPGTLPAASASAFSAVPATPAPPPPQADPMQQFTAAMMAFATAVQRRWTPPSSARSRRGGAAADDDEETGKPGDEWDEEQLEGEEAGAEAMQSPLSQRQLAAANERIVVRAGLREQKASRDGPGRVYGLYRGPKGEEPVPWCVQPLAAQPDFGDVPPFRREDATSKRMTALKMAIAKGEFVDVLASFGRAAIGHSPLAATAVIFQSRWQSERSVAASEEGRALEFLAAFARYTEAVAVLFPGQRAGLQEYARFLSDLLCVVPFERLVVLDREWREWCANWGAPVNAFAAAVETFKASRLLDTGVQVSAARAAPSSSSSASKRRRDREEKREDAAVGARGKRAVEEQVCFNWNAGRACIATPCPRKHVCRHCGAGHAGKDCASGGSGSSGAGEKRRRAEATPAASPSSSSSSSSSTTAAAPPGGKH